MILKGDWEGTGSFEGEVDFEVSSNAELGPRMKGERMTIRRRLAIFLALAFSLLLLLFPILRAFWISDFEAGLRPCGVTEALIETSDTITLLRGSSGPVHFRHLQTARDAQGRIFDLRLYGPPPQLDERVRIEMLCNSEGDVMRRPARVERISQ